MTELSHFSKNGEARMVNVGDKDISVRRARASGHIVVSGETLARIREGGHKKGDVLGVARIAGIMAAKKTAELIPLCHNLNLSHVSVSFDALEDDMGARVECEAVVETVDKTGVEMEALVATQIALVTIYDMCKSMDRGMTISDIRLEEKSGGRSGHFIREGGSPKP